MKKKMRILAVVLVMGISAQTAQAQLWDVLIDALTECIAGGEGSTSCSLTIGGGAGATVAGTGGNGNATITVSTSCGAGYYSCCSLAGGAECKKNED